MSMKRKVKVLLTCIGHQPKELFLRKIKESKKYNYQIIDIFYKVPPGKHKKYKEIIYNICLKHKVNLVLPGADEEVLSLIKIKEKMKKINCFLPILEKKKLDKISSKINLCNYVKNLKIPFYDWKKILERNQLY